MPPAIYSIPAEQPFLDTLVAGLMRRARHAPPILLCRAMQRHYSGTPVCNASA
jgi:hypothetical protein